MHKEQQQQQPTLEHWSWMDYKNNAQWSWMNFNNNAHSKQQQYHCNDNTKKCNNTQWQWRVTIMHNNNNNNEQWTTTMHKNNNEQVQQCATMRYNIYNEKLLVIHCEQWLDWQWLQYCSLVLQHCNAFCRDNFVIGIVGGLALGLCGVLGCGAEQRHWLIESSHEQIFYQSCDMCTFALPVRRSICDPQRIDCFKTFCIGKALVTPSDVQC